MACYRVDIPAGAKVSGVTADGRPAVVLPGEYWVHQLPRRFVTTGAPFRFVGADAFGRDVHVPLAQFQVHLDEETPLTVKPILSAA
jgi:hypothetical protein